MSETTTETTDQPTDDQPTPDAPQAEEKDWKAEADKWKSLARKHEGNAKANADKARQFDEMSEAQMSEIEKATKAREAAENLARESAGELAVFKAALKHGLSEDDLSLLGTHGSPEEIEERAERLAARLKAVEDSKPPADFGGGDRGEDVGGRPNQLTEDDVKRLYAEGKHDEIVKAKADGRLADYLSTPTS